MDDVTRLALGARDGDRRALAELVRRTQADVWRFCAHLVGTQQADDLTQEVYARALRSLPWFRGDGSARVWLLSIARRVGADHVRGEVRRRRLGERLRTEAHRRDRGVDDPGAAGSLATLIGALPEHHRLAFTLTQLLGLSYAEAAAVCRCPTGTVRSRVARARESLIWRIADADAEGEGEGEGEVATS
jgi:RNA polymerase sigma-70 factor (ECF subfamily)